MLKVPCEGKVVRLAALTTFRSRDANWSSWAILYAAMGCNWGCEAAWLLRAATYEVATTLGDATEDKGVSEPEVLLLLDSVCAWWRGGGVSGCDASLLLASAGGVAGDEARAMLASLSSATGISILLLAISTSTILCWTPSTTPARP